MTVFLHGRGLICGLGDSLNDALNALVNGGVQPNQKMLPDGSTRPYFTISAQDLDWQGRMIKLIRQVVQEAGALELKDMPLFIASSCINMSYAEEVNALPDSCWSFAEVVRDALDWRGKVYLLPVACTASLQALLTAQTMIRAGICDEALVLGVELYSRVAASGFASMQLLAVEQSQPLGINRDGIVLGEAATALHLSKTPSRWQLLGGASIILGDDPTGASAEVVRRLCQQVVEACDVSLSDIDLIKLQAAGSPKNDLNELQGISQAFELLPALTTFKHQVGHTLGASGLVEILLLIGCLEKNLNIDFDYPLDHILAKSLVSHYSNAQILLAIILGFSGEHAAVVLKDCAAQYD